MGKRSIRRAIASLKLIIAEHEAKIQMERARESPDQGLIQHWEREMRAFAQRLERLERRLLSRRKRR